MSIKTSLLLAGLACLAGGCATGAPGSSRRICYEAGFQPGTAAFTDCWHRIRDQQFAADAPSILLGVLGAGIAQPPITDAPPPNQGPREFRCVYWTPTGTQTLVTTGVCRPRYGN